VAENSNSALPLFYRVAALWGAHEGSLLLWIMLLALWTVAVAVYASRLPRLFAARVLGVLGVISCGFLLFTLATSNPFLRLDPPALDGRDLNPILQDPGLAGHPPVLYTGYVGFAVAFAFACGAMLEGRMDQNWARWTRPWVTAAWSFLTCGIAMGSFWAYYELGWGGFWFWDPVECASFMPWLVGTALIHSLAVTDKRGLFKSWTLLLSVLAFSLSLLGTFLVRSGVLVSVHSFAADPSRGIFILSFLIVMIGGALSLYAWRAPLLKSPAGFELGARVVSAVQQRTAGDRRRHGIGRHTGAPDIRGARARHGLGRPAVLQPDLHADDAAAARPAVHRHPRELEARPAR
jgi:cytochrome c-type biogenesis protein CcmF